VACGKHPRHAGFEVFIHRDTPVSFYPSPFGELNPRPDANTDDHEIGRQCCTALELDAPSINGRCGIFEMEYDAVFLVNCADEIIEFGAEHAFQRAALWRHDMNLDLTSTQRGGDLEPDEARTEYHRAPRLLCLGDNHPRVAERS